MRPVLSIALWIGFLSIDTAEAQAKLDSLPDARVKTYFSHGHQHRAKEISDRVDNAFSYFKELLAFEPSVKLLVLSQTDWAEHSKMDVVYGMPHYADDGSLVVAAEDNDFFRSFVPTLDELAPDLAEQVKRTHSNEDGVLTMQPFFDLLALHELGHAFHVQAKVNMQRKWLQELYVNILLHTYIAEKEPEQLPALTLFPRMVVAGGTEGFAYTRLEDAHTYYNELGRDHPRNYGWYQCRWHKAAATIYDEGGANVGRTLWDALKAQQIDLTDPALLAFLQKYEKNVAALVENWDAEVK